MLKSMAIFLMGILIVSSCYKQRAESKGEMASINSNISRQDETKNESLPKQPSVKPQQKGLNEKGEIDLSKIEHLTPLARIQDAIENPEYQDMVEKIVKNTDESIPFLIEKLDDETVLPTGIIDWWTEVTVADLAMIILTDIFTDSALEKTTVPGTSWHKMIGWPKPSGDPDFNVLYKYLERHGRKPIKNKWKQTWATYKNNIYWDGKERCFKIN